MKIKVLDIIIKFKNKKERNNFRNYLEKDNNKYRNLKKKIIRN